MKSANNHCAFCMQNLIMQCPQLCKYISISRSQVSNLLRFFLVLRFLSPDAAAGNCDTCDTRRNRQIIQVKNRTRVMTNHDARIAMPFLVVVKSKQGKKSQVGKSPPIGIWHWLDQWFDDRWPWLVEHRDHGLFRHGGRRQATVEQPCCSTQFSLECRNGHRASDRVTETWMD